MSDVNSVTVDLVVVTQFFVVDVVEHLRHIF